ncbi:hypothetical protein EF847_08455 [Actinobacteria bacterium YIM 96077]|uniref:M23ase beta-sheet core domain-containing protein n=1 Tax=Phytoactinopolyspora halophila TaxID=1981511 RepID=A0A329QWW8_9ACTN|nr:peptidoglycan DD-metalloendopeptidase family protein [Phytoactinopolyspora halophila]AYY12740.1 hypothetical protein EF847_08455 [Actinobacteria bacterium YIM 96077]RAW16466.1 hypothetical protein DPM12_07565 [Phytoactinopolyspora halophila]
MNRARISHAVAGLLRRSVSAVRNVATLLLIALPLASTAAAAAPDEGWVYPVGPPAGPVDVVRGFEPPEQAWLAGNRGVELRAPVGSEVRAANAGEVTYAGPLAGRGVVVVQHDELRTTYEPVDATVSAGALVSAGEPIGTVAAHGNHCAPESCVHWGAIEANTYIDPLTLVDTLAVRLLPLGNRALTEEPPPDEPGEPDKPDDFEDGSPDPPDDTDRTAERLHWPVTNPYVTSPYGMRIHPVTGERRLHDGTDFRARCGTPIRAAAPGRVRATGHYGPYGLQVTIHHGSLSGVSITTSYSHLSHVGVHEGQRVASQEVIGRAGTTGRSTGCHLHFMTYIDGSLKNPMPWLPSGQ